MATLHIILTSNKKAWVKTMLFQEWFVDHFVVAVKNYYKGSNLAASKIVLVLGNAPGHPLTLRAWGSSVSIVS
jgi:hypothetical protein